MAKMKLSEDTGFILIPEGVHVFKVMEVDDSKYEDFGKVVVKLQTVDGKTISKTFSFYKKKGELNEGTLKAWSYFARTCLNNFSADEIDTQDIVGCYVKTTIKHTEFESNKEAGKMLKGAEIQLFESEPASGFGSSKVSSSPVEDDEDDLDFD